MKSYVMCNSCKWDYITLHHNFDSSQMIDGYCPECNPKENKMDEDRKINDERRELGRVIYLLEDNPTPEQIEAEIFKERADIISMSQEELEQHIDALDKLYKSMQQEAKKVKTKTIAALEIKREKYGNGKVKKSLVKKEKKDINDEIDALLGQADLLMGSKLKQE